MKKKTDAKKNDISKSLKALDNILVEDGILDPALVRKQIDEIHQALLLRVSHGDKDRMLLVRDDLMAFINNQFGRLAREVVDKTNRQLLALSKEIDKLQPQIVYKPPEDYMMAHVDAELGRIAREFVEKTNANLITMANQLSQQLSVLQIQMTQNANYLGEIQKEIDRLFFWRGLFRWLRKW